jgi:Ni/Co efflux regulator RcnB
MPRTYYSTPSYYVANPARYHLRPPPPGYRWVFVDGRYYLVQTRTGLISQLVTSLVR